MHHQTKAPPILGTKTLLCTLNGQTGILHSKPPFTPRFEPFSVLGFGADTPRFGFLFGTPFDGRAQFYAFSSSLS